MVNLGMQVLPNYPLPTHHVVVRGGAPTAFAVSKMVLKLRSSCSPLRSVNINMFTNLLFVTAKHCCI